jgi:hypothetical protein
MGGGTRPQKSGQFEIDDVSPGSYELMAAGNGAYPDTVLLPIEVADVDVNGLELSIVPPIDVHGHIRFDGASRIDLGSIQLWAQSPGKMMQATAAVTRDGAFTIPTLATRKYQLGINMAGAEIYIKSVRIGDRDVPDRTLDLTQGAGNVEIVAASSSGRLEGSVIDENQPSQNGAAVSGANVVLVPEIPTGGEFGGVRFVTTDTRGNFSFKVLPRARTQYLPATAWKLSSGAIPNWRKRLMVMPSKCKSARTRRNRCS